MPDPVIAPYVPSYATAEPYLTAAEYQAAPNAVNTSTITPGQSAAVNADALSALIVNASSWVDSICNQTIGATVETQAGTYRVQDGRIAVPVSFMPIVQVNGWSTGSPGALTAADDLTGVGISTNVISIPFESLRDFALGLRGRVYVEVEYVAGYANTMLADAATAPTATLEVTSTVGIFPGLPLRIYDPGRDETVTVESVSGTTVTLTAPITKDHVAGVNVTALPGAAKQATILLVTALIKGRSAQSITMQGMQATSTSRVVRTIDGTEEVERAVSLLRGANLMRVA